MALFQNPSVGGLIGATGNVLPYRGIPGPQGYNEADPKAVADHESAAEARAAQIFSGGGGVGLNDPAAYGISPYAAAGSYPIKDGIPSGPPVDGFPQDARVGYNYFGPQPVTGLSAAEQAARGGPVTCQQALDWWNSGGSQGTSVGKGGVSGTGQIAGGGGQPFFTDARAAPGSQQDPFDFDNFKAGSTFPDHTALFAPNGADGRMWRYIGDDNQLISNVTGGHGGWSNYQFRKDQVFFTSEKADIGANVGGWLNGKPTTGKVLQEIPNPTTGGGAQVQPNVVNVNQPPQQNFFGSLFGGSGGPADFNQMFQLMFMMKMLSFL